MLLIDRRERDGRVLEHLDERAAEADQHDRPEALVLARADDQLDAVGEVGGALDEQAGGGEPVMRELRARWSTRIRRTSKCCVHPS